MSTDPFKKNVEVEAEVAGIQIIKTSEGVVSVEAEVEEKEDQTQNEDALEYDLEEGEIFEPDAADKEVIDEDEEFADEYAMHDDCLMNRINEIINDDIEQAKEFVIRQRLRRQMISERNNRIAREEDIKNQTGPRWEEARISFNGKEKNLEVNDNGKVMDIIRDMRGEYPDIHEFYQKFNERVSSVSVSQLKKGWIMYVNLVDRRALRLSTKMFRKMNVVELFVLKSKIITSGGPINELLRERMHEALREYSPEAFQSPSCVKYYHGRTLQNLTLSVAHMMATPYNLLMYIESRLRGKGDRRTGIDLGAAEIIYAMRLNMKMEVCEKDMREIRRAYNDIVWAPGPDGTLIDEEEYLGEGEPKTCVENGELKYIIRNPTTNTVTRVPISEFESSRSEFIREVLKDVQSSTCKNDKLALKPIQEKLMNRLEVEQVNNTKRVQDFPKRITVYVLSKKSSLLFSAVRKMESVSYLRQLLRKLEEPAPVNALEVEARDLVKQRISHLEQKLQKRKVKTTKKSEAEKAKSDKKTKTSRKK